MKQGMIVVARVPRIASAEEHGEGDKDKGGHTVGPVRRYHSRCYVSQNRKKDWSGMHLWGRSSA